MKEKNIEILNNIIAMIGQLELKGTQQNTIILYNLYININKIIENIANVSDKKIEMKEDN